MRPLEALLLAANLLAFLALAVPRLRGSPWAGYLPVVAALVAVAQVALERYRWQMVPADVLTAALLIVWLARRAAADTGVNGALAGLAIGLGALVLLVSIALPLVLPEYRFPPPSGPHAIGTVTYHWVDDGRTELFTTDPEDRRELMVQVWYPAIPREDAPRAPYMRDAGALTTWVAWLLHVNLPDWLSGRLTSVTTNAVAGAPVATVEPRYPVVVFLEGLSGFRQMNTYQVEELVSHGYVVVALDQPYTAASMTFPDGRRVTGISKEEIWPAILQSIRRSDPAPVLRGRTLEDGIIPYLARDASFALDRLENVNRADPEGVLTGALDLGRVGLIGVSLGAIVGPEACHLDERLGACMFMEAPVTADVIAAGLEQPTFLQLADDESLRLAGWSEADIDLHRETMRSLYTNLAGDGYFLSTHGTFHLNLTDAPLLLRIPLRVLGLLGPIDVARAHGIIKAYTVGFFDRYLRGSPAPLLDERQAFAEAVLESRAGSPQATRR